MQYVKRIALFADKYLASTVQFDSPFAHIQGIDEMMKAIDYLIAHFTTLTIRSVFDTQDKTIVIYDLSFSAPIGSVPTVAFLTIANSQISTIKLLFDKRPFQK